ncbi:hypothetical protein BDQ17DRAFT_1428986 [Cyathus striatus]|nr:hypothetical protein BDQ17DRAFT_1428986 [Cyathus striatus]
MSLAMLRFGKVSLLNLLILSRLVDVDEFRISMIILESFLFALTFSKRNIESRHANIVGTVVRDGGKFFVFMVVARIFTLLTGSWKLTIFSVFACKLVKGLLQICTEPPTVRLSASSTDNVELTSFINIE